MTLGPLTRKALHDAGIRDDLLDGIDRGEFEWNVGLEPAVGFSASEEAAAEKARAAAARKDFVIVIRRTEDAQRSVDPYLIMPKQYRRVYETAVPTAVGQRIDAARRYETALGTRGSVASSLFPPGNLDEWLVVEPNASWDTVAFEFRLGAETLARAYAPSTPFPTMALLYMCRHHLELMLKAIILAGDELAGRQISVPIGHPLQPLWDRALPLMQASWATGWDQAECDAAGAVIAEFEETDRSAMATRYPVDKAGAPFPRKSNLANFSLAGFIAQFSRAADFLGGAALWIHVDLMTRKPRQAVEV